jgi:N-acetylmuramoyl-L-alanine amidase
MLITPVLLLATVWLCPAQEGMGFFNEPPASVIKKRREIVGPQVELGTKREVPKLIAPAAPLEPPPAMEPKETPSPEPTPAMEPKPGEPAKAPESAPQNEPPKPAEPGKDAPPMDVTNSKATTRDMEGKDSEFHGADPEDIAKEKEEAAKAAAAKKEPGKATTKSSSDMPGWELVHYQERDYVTANSIHRFYRFNNLSVEGNSVWFRSPVLIMKASSGSQELLINNIKFVMSYPVVELNGKMCFSRLDLCKLIDPVLRPSYISSTSGPIFDTVIIDPGHGGHDSGAKGIYGYEKDFTLKLAFKLKAMLEKQGIKVVMTRSTDVFMSLGGRVAVANKIPNSIYVSLHFNSGGSSATGIETFALSPQGSASVYGARETDYVAFQGNQRDSENIALATAIHASVVHQFKLVDRGVKRARWHVLKGLQRPGVLFEGGFITNPSDGRLIAATNFQDALANNIGQAIMNYRRALQPKSR